MQGGREAFLLKLVGALKTAGTQLFSCVRALFLQQKARACTLGGFHNLCAFVQFSSDSKLNVIRI
jgi:hypothetical protein